MGSSIYERRSLPSASPTASPDDILGFVVRNCGFVFLARSILVWGRFRFVPLGLHDRAAIVGELTAIVVSVA